MLGTGFLSLGSVVVSLDERATLAVVGGSLAYVAAVLATLRARAQAEVRPVAVAAALGIGSLPVLLIAASGRVPPPVAAIGLAVVALGWLTVIASRPRPSVAPAVVGSAVLAAASATLVIDRHLLVASGVAPDDVALVLLGLALLWALVRRAHARLEATLIALAFVCLAGAGVAFVAGTRYHSDAVVAVHRSAEHVLAGADPYQALDVREALARFATPAELLTNYEDGSELRGLNYPALAFLLPAPFVAAGLTDIRWLYLAEVLLLAALVVVRTPPGLRALATAAVIGNVVIARQFVAAGVDPAWALLTALAIAMPERRVASALAMGLATAARQTAWFVAPFYLAIAWRRGGPREALLRAAVLTLGFVVPNAPFIAHDPGAWSSGVLAPLVGPLEPHGIGLVRLGIDGAMPLLPRGAYAALAGAALGLLLVASLSGPPRAWRAAAVAPLAVLWLAWRSLASYLAFIGVFALLEGGTGVLSRERTEVRDAGRQGAARDPRVS